MLTRDSIIQENEVFKLKAHDSLKNLFEKALRANEVQFALTMFPEYRGAQAKFWNTAIECRKAYDDYLAYLDTAHAGSIKVRISLGMYCHIAEASGFYELPKNLLRIIEGTGWQVRPFDSLVKEHLATGERIAPNANKIMRDLSGHANTIGHSDLAEVFRDLVNADVRNSFAHADYVLGPHGINICKRNGSHSYTMPYSVFSGLLTRLIEFFRTMWKIHQEFVMEYSPAKVVSGYLNDSQFVTVSISYDPVSESFSLSSST